jgi:hypothetical protein
MARDKKSIKDRLERRKLLGAMGASPLVGIKSSEVDLDDGNTYIVWLGRAVDLEGDRSGTWGNDPHEITGIFTMHETGHCYDARHHDGDYIVKDNERYNVTPMATAYVCPQDRDTCFEASNTTPSQFCSRDNEPCEGAAWCDPCYDLCRHTSSMTGGTNCDGASNRATKEKIYQNTPLE